MQGTSKELVEVCVSALEKYPNVLAKCSTEIREEYFENNHYKLIYKCLKEYYGNYLTIPSYKELALLIREKYSEEYGIFEEVLETLDKIHKMKLSSEDFAMEKSIEFIKRCKLEKSLNLIVKNIDSNGKVDLDRAADILQEGLSLSFSKTTPFNLADISMVSEVKKDAVGTEESSRIVKMFIEAMNGAFQYKGLIPGTLNAVAACPGCGKSMFLVNQGLCTAQQGYKVLHMFLGDLNKYDGMIRYLACLSGVDSEKLINFSNDELIKFIQKVNMSGFLSNVDIVAYKAGELTTNQLMEEVLTIQKNKEVHYDSVIIDYDENLADNNLDEMYKSGGEIYNKLAGFAVSNKCVVWIASQIGREFWKYEIPPLESMAQSSNKQKVLDLLLTIGKPSKTSSVLTVCLVKNRRGDEGRIYRTKFEGRCCRLTHISEEEYETLKKLDKATGGVIPDE